MTMRKKLLFTIGVLDGGGVAKSLLSLLSVIDKSHYDVSLLIAGTDCGRNKDVPPEVTIITDKVLADVVAGAKGIKELLLSGHFILLVGSLMRLLFSRINRGWAGWWLSRLMPVVTNENYDLIVDYNGQHMLYYMVDKLKGNKKVTFFHSDYRMWRYYENIDRRYYGKVERIFTISGICVEGLRQVFPEYSEKIQMIENITSPAHIEQMAQVAIDYRRQHQYVLLSLGHVCKNKGCDIAIEVAERLKKDGIDFEWLFLGTISSDMDYLGAAKKKGLADNMLYMGNIANPYPYIREADLFVHLSLFEGKSIALDEAKLMCKPIVVTNFSSVTDQFTDGINASICQMNAEDATQKIINLLNNTNLQKKYIDCLQNEVHDNSSEVEIIYQLLN